jgi:hypothetical protein
VIQIGGPRRRRCVALTAKGAPCKRAPALGVDRCSVHLGRRAIGQEILTPEIADRIVAMLTAGAFLGPAASSAGVSRRTLSNWLARGQSGDPEDTAYRDLAERVEKARATAQVRAVAIVSRAAEEDWRAAAWFLERSDPLNWGRPVRRVVSSADDEDLAVPATEVEKSPDPFAEVDELAARRARLGPPYTQRP